MSTDETVFQEVSTYWSGNTFQIKESLNLLRGHYDPFRREWEIPNLLADLAKIAVKLSKIDGVIVKTLEGKRIN